LNFHLHPNFIKLDETIYYRNHYIKIQNSLKAIDILTIKDNKNYFIEIKDLYAS